MLPPALYQLLGYPGTGKYTVARALVARLEAAGATARLIDNHYVANPIFGLLPVDGVTPLPPEVWARVRGVRAEVLATIEALSPPEWSFVFTNYWQDTESHAVALAHLEELAAKRGNLLVPVMLTVDRDELLRRVVRPDRAARLKLVDPEGALRCLDEQLLTPTTPASLTLDITDLSPTEAADRILDHTRAQADPRPHR
jgi:hypothetical protein